MESRIKVDIDELMDKLQDIKDDDYTTVELRIVNDEYSSELELGAYSFDSDEPKQYGSIDEVLDEI